MARSAASNRFALRDSLSSLSFSGVDQYVDIGTAVDNSIAATGQFTIDCFFKTRQTGFQTLVCLGGGGTGKLELNLSSGSQVLGARLTDGSNVEANFASGSGGRILRDVWYKGTLTYASDVATLYLNGASVGTKAYVGLTVTDGVNRIGVRPTVNDDFNGLIDEVRIWTRALNATEVSDLYFKNIVPATGLIAEYLFNEGAGTTATDSSGSGNTGTISGATFSADVPMKARKQINGNLVKNGDFEYAPPFTAATESTDRWIDGSQFGSTTNNLFGWKLASTSLSPTVTSISARYRTVSGRNCVQIVSVGAMRKSGATVTGLGVFNTAYTGATLLEADRLNLIPVFPNTAYTLSEDYFTSQIDAGITPVVTAVEYDSTLTRIATNTVLGATDVSTDWRTLSGRFTTASTTRYVSVSGRIQAGGGVDFDNGNATVAFDNISLLPVYPEGRVPANGNLVKNFDFEVAPTFTAVTTVKNRWIDGTASGSSSNKTYKWAINNTNTSGTAYAASFDSSVSHTGTYSMKVSTTATASVIVVSNVIIITPTALLDTGIYASPNTSYTYSFWMKTNYVSGDSDGAYMIFRSRNGAGSTVASATSTKVKTTTDWTQYTGTFTTAADAVWIEPFMIVDGNAGTGTLIMDAWFDDIYLAPTTNPGRIQIT